MIVIFGWDYKKNITLGPVLEHQCPYCSKKEIWHLSKRSTYFTIFFIPIFSYEINYRYLCSYCRSGIQLDKQTFEIFKTIAEANMSFHEGTLTEQVRIKIISDLYSNPDCNQIIQKIIDHIEHLPEDFKKKEIELENEQALELEKRRIDAIKESPKWYSLAESKSDSELLNILNRRYDYNPALIIAIEKEIEKRKLEN